MLRFKVTTDVKGIEKKRKQKNAKIVYLLVNEVLKDSNYFIPKDTGALETSGIIESLQSNKGEVSWNTPYARRLYWNPQFKFSKDVNPNARGLWFEAAKTQFGDNWVAIAQKVWT